MESKKGHIKIDYYELLDIDKNATDKEIEKVLTFNYLYLSTYIFEIGV